MKHLLVVDDDPLTLEIAQLSLEMAGWQVSTAHDGAEALLLAVELRPDAILMDVMMPGMDGPTACRTLAANPDTAGIPVILFTAKVRASEQTQWAALPVAGVLSKPFDPVVLGASVRSLLGWD